MIKLMKWVYDLGFNAGHEQAFKELHKMRADKKMSVRLNSNPLWLVKYKTEQTNPKRALKKKDSPSNTTKGVK